jgi:Fe-S cluster biogenesis protein NfuA
MAPAVDPAALASALAMVRPLILGHGGDVEVERVDEGGIVHVRLVGACRACPNMAMTYVGPLRTGLMRVAGVTDVRCEQVNAGPRALARLARLLGAQPFAGWSAGTAN